MRLDWDGTHRNYDIGVDRGVLYFYSPFEEAVPWNGLISVSQQTQASSATPRYFEGAVFNLEQKIEDYVANVEAFVYPYMLEDHILAMCDGRTLVGAAPELNPFGFTYRTMTASAYKIHFVYNVTAVVEPITYETFTDQINPQTFRFTFHTVPVETPGIKPTAHFILDVDRAGENTVALVEKLLYGTDETQPHFPSIDELVALIAAGEG